MARTMVRETGDAGQLSYHHPERDVPWRDRCFRLAFQHLERKHGYVPPGTQLELG